MGYKMQLEMEDNAKKTTNRRLVYVLLFLIIALPVIVGVLVWHFVSDSCDNSNSSLSSATDANTGNKQTTLPVTSPEHSDTEPWRNLRLPRDAMPIHYNITLYPNIYNGNGWFYGNETIEIRIEKDTSIILIHKHYMNITKTELRQSSGTAIEIKQPFYFEENQFWVIETKQVLKSGTKVLLDLSFDGSLTRAIVGFYKSKYVNSLTNETRFLATSKFEPVDARRAFPCFDEPNIKAEYTVHLVHQDGYTALSNMPETDTVTWSEDSSLQITTFQRSVKMSTYLVCFIVCDFEYLERKTKFNTTVRTYATPDRVNQTQYSLKIAVHTMELYQELFNVSYPLPKQDMIAIPDFVSGAMEHWGLITYREVNMLYDPEQASPANKQRVAIVVAHEISHQWFGNIVTMDWWDDLWLNEGFASFIEYVGANSAEPEWEMLQQLVTEDVQPVMITDAGVSSHPIVVNVNNPNQINEVFDSISYSKGSAVIRMLESIMGRENFFLGVGNYLKKFVWANAKTDDLWNELNNVNSGGFGVKPMMDTWTRQMGFPYINITMTTGGSSTSITATQQRFLSEKNTEFDPNTSAYGYKWYVYLDYLTSTNISNHVWINQSQSSVTFDVPEVLDAKKWIKFNLKQTGFYRVNYPGDIWTRFAASLQDNPQTMSNVDKAGLIDDAFNLARAGYITYDIPLTLTKYLDNERSHLPWESAYTALAYVSKMMQSGMYFSEFRMYTLQKSKPVLEELGWADNGTHLQKLMRTNLISLTCGLGDKDCLTNATDIFRKWLDQGVSVTPNIRSLVYKYGMQNGGSPEDWDTMWNKYKVETVPQEQIKLLYGLSSTKTLWLLTRYLEYSKDENMVRSQDFFTVIQYIARNPIGKTLAWDWIRSNWEYMVKRFTTYSRSLGRMVPAVISDFNTDFQLKEVEDFFKQYPDAGAGARGRVQAVESIKANIQWRKQHERHIRDWICRTINTC